MPKIPVLVEAEQKMARAEQRMSSLTRELQAARDLVDLLNEKCTSKLRAPLRRLEKARELQRRTLTAWVPNEAKWRGTVHESYTRYRLKQSGESDKCWDSRAWLRMMAVGGQRQWTRQWTLDIRYESTSRHILPTPDDVQSVLDVPREWVLDWADGLLLAAGLNLSDLVNEGDEPVSRLAGLLGDPL